MIRGRPAAISAATWEPAATAGESAAGARQTAGAASRPGCPAGARRSGAGRGDGALTGGQPAHDLGVRVALEPGDDVDGLLRAVLQHLDRGVRAGAADRGVRDVENVVALTRGHR